MPGYVRRKRGGGTSPLSIPRGKDDPSGQPAISRLYMYGLLILIYLEQNKTGMRHTKSSSQRRPMNVTAIQICLLNMLSRLRKLQRFHIIGPFWEWRESGRLDSLHKRPVKRKAHSDGRYWIQILIFWEFP